MHISCLISAIGDARSYDDAGDAPLFRAHLRYDGGRNQKTVGQPNRASRDTQRRQGERLAQVGNHAV